MPLPPNVVAHSTRYFVFDDKPWGPKEIWAISAQVTRICKSNSVSVIGYLSLEVVCLVLCFFFFFFPIVLIKTQIRPGVAAHISNPRALGG